MRRYARRIVNHFRDKRAFAALPKADCDASPLAPASDFDPKQVFGRDDAAWKSVEAEVQPLRISETAGGVNAGDRRAVYELVRYLRPAAMLEAGTHVGASTVHIARALKDLHAEDAGTARHLDTVDIIDVNDAAETPWLKFESTYSPAEMIGKLGCDGMVTFHARNALDWLAECDRKFDFIFLDDDHDAAHVYQELPLALKLLKPHGYVLLHDYFPDGKPLWSNNKVIHGPYWAVRRLQEEGAPLAVVPLGALPWPTKLGSNVTSLALLGHA